MPSRHCRRLEADGFIIDIAASTDLSRPLHIVHVATTQQPAATAARSLVMLGPNATATLVESFLACDGAGAYQTFDMTTLRASATKQSWSICGWSRTSAGDQSGGR